MNRLADVASAFYVTWVLSLACGMLCQQLFILSGWRLAGAAFRFCAFVFQELWIVAPAFLLVCAAKDWHDHYYLAVAFEVLWLFNWWWYRNWPDENRWKRRGRKLKDAIVVRAGRLVVQPA